MKTLQRWSAKQISCPAEIGCESPWPGSTTCSAHRKRSCLIMDPTAKPQVMAGVWPVLSLQASNYLSEPYLAYKLSPVTPGETPPQLASVDSCLYQWTCRSGEASACRLAIHQSARSDMVHPLLQGVTEIDASNTLRRIDLLCSSGSSSIPFRSPVGGRDPTSCQGTSHAFQRVYCWDGLGLGHMRGSQTWNISKWTWRFHEDSS